MYGSNEIDHNHTTLRIVFLRMVLYNYSPPIDFCNSIYTFNLQDSLLTPNFKGLHAFLLFQIHIARLSMYMYVFVFSELINE